MMEGETYDFALVFTKMHVFKFPLLGLDPVYCTDLEMLSLYIINNTNSTVYTRDHTIPGWERH